MAATQTATARPAARPATRTSTRRKVLWALQILIAAFLLFASAMPKFAGQVDAIETFAKLGWPEWTRYAVGAVEAAGAIGLVIPRLAGLAAAGLVGLMVGAVLTQLLVLVPAWAAFPAVLGVIFAVIAYDRREETRSLLRSPKR
ncbi:hypothetical protein GCM10009678_75280 [Actinomadura kijaniata]|uniref:Putative membrane protein n=1 Tax=Actinomadura namibiensis TaxID=182080 RepID=A0A7W3QRB9_ACTNM|nr:DoxX family protein [Actinomadura namibiensis]MBA8956635.1 putative membrane protein [Actinomadura namibiensis]